MWICITHRREHFPYMALMSVI